MCLTLKRESKVIYKIKNTVALLEREETMGIFEIFDNKLDSSLNGAWKRQMKQMLAVLR